MKIEKIVLEGFLSYKKRQEIDLSVVSTCLVLGRINNDPDLSNGAGKSSLFEVIPVNFFGKGSGRADLLDSYINDTMSKMYTEIIFKLDDQRFKSVRSKVRNSSGVFEVYQDSTNKTLEKATWKKIDRQIEEILGLSAKTYSSTIYLNERDSLQVITGTSSERKEILRELLNIDVYEKAAKLSSKNFDNYDKKVQVNINLIQDKQKQLEQEEQVKDELKHIEIEIKTLKKSIKNLEIDLKAKNEERGKIEVSIETEKIIRSQLQQEQNNVLELTKKISKLNFEIKTLDSELISQTETYNRLKKTIEDSVKSKEQIESSRVLIENILKKLDDVDKALKQITKEIKTKTGEKSKIDTELSVLRSESKPLKSFLERLSEFKSICPVTELECSVLQGEYKSNLKEEKEKELESNKLKVKDLEKTQQEYQEELKKLTKKEDELTDLSQTRQIENEKLSKLKLQLQTIDNNEERFKEKEKEFDQYKIETKKEKDDLSIQITENTTKSKLLSQKIKDMESSLNKELQQNLQIVSKEIKDLELDISNTRSSLDDKNQEFGEIKNQIDKLEKMKVEIVHLTKNNEENVEQKRIYQSLESIFGKDGIQKSLMKESIPMLEKYTSEFLKIFNDDSEKLKIKFDLDPKRQDGEYKKGGGLEILVIEEGKEPKDLQMYSGGETVRIVFSIVLSLAKLLSLRAGKKHEALIIDEKIAKLDSRGIEQFGQVISEISKIYKQVFVITHIDSLKNLVNGDEIIVNKTEEGSLVSVS